MELTRKVQQSGVNARARPAAAEGGNPWARSEGAPPGRLPTISRTPFEAALHALGGSSDEDEAAGERSRRASPEGGRPEDGLAALWSAADAQCDAALRSARATCTSASVAAVLGALRSGAGACERRDPSSS